MVVKFPHGEAKAEVKALVGSSTDFTDVAVSEPKKMLPKMTLLDGCSPSLPDGEIISGILDKNPQIKESLNAGHTLTLFFFFFFFPELVIARNLVTPKRGAQQRIPLLHAVFLLAPTH